MNKHIKRFLIACILPLLATILACGFIYYKNSHETVAALVTGEQESVIEGEEVTLTKSNWEEYFEYVAEYVPVKNEAGEVVKVQLNAYYKMKDEYYEKFSRASEEVIVILSVEDLYTEYEILDPKTGEWELTGKDSKYESKFYELYIAGMGNDRDMCFWDSSTNKCEVNGNHYLDELDDEIFIQVIDKVEVEAASGWIYFR